MRRPKILPSVLLMLLAMASAAAAKPQKEPAEPPLLYAFEKTAIPQGNLPLLPNAAEEHLIQLDPATVAANPSAFLIDLPGHGLIEAVRTGFVDYQADWKSWFGDLRYADNGQATGSIYIGFHGDRITALVELEDGERYRIAGGPEEGQRLVRLDAALTPLSCGLQTKAEAVEPPLLRPLPRAEQPPSRQKILSCSANASIDVLVVYPSKGVAPQLGYFELTAAEETALRTFVQSSISLANQIFVNNGINASYRLVGLVPLINRDNQLEPPLPATGLEDAVDWLNDEHTELRNLRTAFGADIVAVYIPFNWRGGANPHPSDAACGVANLRLAGNSMEVLEGAVSFNQRAFSAHRDGCGLDDLTLAHEIGHNYGMRHHDDNQVASFRYPWGRGYNFVDSSGVQRATVMGCTCTSGCTTGQAVCNRIKFFSDPDKTSGGVPIGTSNAHNARVACDEVGNYAALRLPSMNTAPSASFTVSCTGRTCTFNASATSDNAAIPSNNYWWDYGNGAEIVRGTKTHTYTYPAAGSFRAHLVVKDKDGQTNVTWRDANPWNPIYEGVHETSNCGTIHGWAWDKTKPNDPINVDIYRDGSKVATVPANLCRQDLLAAGKGNGCHGFHYAPNSGWRDGRWHTATVRFPGTSTNLSSTGHQVICDASIFTTQVPTENLPTGGQVYTVATQFSSNRSGYITRLWFYRANGETGTNTLRLWTDNGVPLADVPTNCGFLGWCSGDLWSPVFITAGTRYRVSVNTNTYQSKTGCGIGSGIYNDPLTAHSGYWIAGDTFPTQGSCSNFFVDVSFDL